MSDLEKIIKGFECCHVMVHDLGPDKTSCGICPYMDAQTEEQIDLGGIECIAALHDDALAMLKEQETEDTGRCRIFQCKKCGFGIDDIFVTDEEKYQIVPRYCPNCGRSVK